MDPSSVAPANQLRTETPEGTNLQGGWLVLARITWVSIVGLALLFFFASLPSYFASLHVLSPTHATAAGTQISLKDLRTLQAAGLSLDFYAWYNVLLSLFFVLAYAAVGLLIFWRKSTDRMALIASFTLVLFSLDMNLVIWQSLSPAWGLLVNSINFLGSVSMQFFLSLFPSGRIDRRWIGWLTAGMLIYWVLDVFVPFPPSALYALLSFGLFVFFTAAGAVIQVYRYRHISTPIQRQQSKWVFFGILVGVPGYLIGILVVFGLFNGIWQAGMVPFMIGYTILDLLLLLLPLCIAVAILRSHLWEIDSIINRTLVYSALTAILALIYAALVLGLQVLLHGLIPQTNNVALVLSTLAIAALFQPLRKRIQNIIDRRFYRRKYDAIKTLEAFSAALRTDVNLEELCRQLLTVVQETVQPEHVSLWLRQPARNAPQQENTSGHRGGVVPFKESHR